MTGQLDITHFLWELFSLQCIYIFSRPIFGCVSAESHLRRSVYPRFLLVLFRMNVFLLSFYRIPCRLPRIQYIQSLSWWRPTSTNTHTHLQVKELPYSRLIDRCWSITKCLFFDNCWLTLHNSGFGYRIVWTVSYSSRHQPNSSKIISRIFSTESLSHILVWRARAHTRIEIKRRGSPN